MNKQELKDLKECLVEVAKEYIPQTTRKIFLDDLNEVFAYLARLKYSNAALRAEIQQLKKGGK